MDGSKTTIVKETSRKYVCLWMMFSVILWLNPNLRTYYSVIVVHLLVRVSAHRVRVCGCFYSVLRSVQKTFVHLRQNLLLQAQLLSN